MSSQAIPPKLSQWYANVGRIFEEGQTSFSPDEISKLIKNFGQQLDEETKQLVVKELGSAKEVIGAMNRLSASPDNNVQRNRKFHGTVLYFYRVLLINCRAIGLMTEFKCEAHGVKEHYHQMMIMLFFTTIKRVIIFHYSSIFLICWF